MRTDTQTVGELAQDCTDDEGYRQNLKLGRMIPEPVVHHARVKSGIFQSNQESMAQVQSKVVRQRHIAGLAVCSEQEEVTEQPLLPVVSDWCQVTQWQWQCLASVWAS